MGESSDKILTEAAPGEPPKGWSLTTLGEVATLQRGNDLPVSERKEGPFPVVGSNGVVGYHDEFVAHGPGVLVGRSGSVGKVTWVESDYWPLNTALWVKDFHGNHPIFVYFLLSSVDLSCAAAGVSVPTLNRNLVHPLRIYLPPIPEQRAIAHVLHTVQQTKEATARLIDAARQLKQSLLRHLFTYGPVPFDQADRVTLKETDYGQVPELWNIRPLTECATVQTGVAKGRKIDNGEAVIVPYLRVANVQDGYLDLAEIKTITIRRAEMDRYSLQSGDVVLTEGGDFDKLGRGFIWNGEVPICVHQNHIFAVRSNRAILVPEFLAYLTQSTYGKSYFLSVAHKTTNLACINTTKLKSLPVLLPSLDEQHNTVAALQAVDKKIEVEIRRSWGLDALFQTLLHHLVTGKVRVHDVPAFAPRGAPTEVATVDKSSQPA